MNVICLHGFLGSPADWKNFELEKRLGYQVSYPDLFQDDQKIVPFWEWAEAFNADISYPTILVGYSLGGRLAMHAVLRRPDLYKGAVIISSHYGLNNEEEKKIRLAGDLAWAGMFRNEKWEAVMHDWNNQAVFRNDTFSIPREEKESSRKALARALDVWSLGRQDYLKSQIEKLSVPILFIVGERDRRYAALAKSIHFLNSYSNIWIAPESGHRVPWHQQNTFTERLYSFIHMIQGEPYVSRNDTMEPCQTLSGY